MTTNDAVSRYHPLAIGAHWLMLALLIAVYASIELSGIFPKGSASREAMRTWHEMLGITIFGLVFVRLALRLVLRTPVVTPAPPDWQRFLASAMHVALYAFLVAMPLLGWLMMSAKAKATPFFGLQLPALIGPDKALAHDIEDIHEVIGVIGYYLVGLHAGAALFHHYLMRDDTLRRMLPGSRRPSAGSAGVSVT